MYRSRRPASPFSRWTVSSSDRAVPRGHRRRSVVRRRGSRIPRRAARHVRSASAHTDELSVGRGFFRPAPLPRVRVDRESLLAGALRLGSTPRKRCTSVNRSSARPATSWKHESSNAPPTSGFPRSATRARWSASNDGLWEWNPSDRRAVRLAARQTSARRSGWRRDPHARRPEGAWRLPSRGSATHQRCVQVVPRPRIRWVRCRVSRDRSCRQT